MNNAFISEEICAKCGASNNVKIDSVYYEAGHVEKCTACAENLSRPYVEISDE